MKVNLSFLIIEDDKYARLNLREILNPFGLIDEASNIDEALKKLTKSQYDIILTDIELGQESGVDLIEKIVRRGSHCIVVSSYENDDIVEKAYSLGAKHFLSKFKIKDQLPVYINKFIQQKNARFEKFVNEDFITQDTQLIEDLRKLCDVNWKNQTLFIQGPSGTGKSLLGKLIHELTYKNTNLVHINCSEFNENLLESELFGHEKGAFTGAENKKDGKLKLADGGTLFLDEVATMPLSMQNKLLKALDEKTFYPVGSVTPIKCNFTLITATCENIKEKIRKKDFREDLFYRISGYTFNLKPLKERSQDIELLIRHFQKKSLRRYVLKPEAIELLKKYQWPGNIRELLKLSDRFSQSSNGVIDRKDVEQILIENEITISQVDQWNEYVLKYGLKSLLSQIEKQSVEESMKRNSGKITACIKELKISSSAFYRILQENHIQA